MHPNKESFIVKKLLAITICNNYNNNERLTHTLKIQ